MSSSEKEVKRDNADGDGNMKHSGKMVSVSIYVAKISTLNSFPSAELCCVSHFTSQKLKLLKQYELQSRYFQKFLYPILG